MKPGDDRRGRGGDRCGIAAFDWSRTPLGSRGRWPLALRTLVASIVHCGGAAYARASAEELGIADCFEAFLPKPNVLLDDVRIADWSLVELHPNECRGLPVADLLARRR